MLARTGEVTSADEAATAYDEMLRILKVLEQADELEPDETQLLEEIRTLQEEGAKD